MWKVISLVLLTILLISYRVLGSTESWWLQNVSPFVALFFCAGVFRTRYPWLLPVVVAAWLLSNPISSMIQGYSPFHESSFILMLVFALIVWGGTLLKAKPSWLPVLGGTIVSAVVFYGLTNLFCFFTSPLYAKTWEGFAQALWFGLPQFEVPTWAFFRNSLVSSTVFSVLFLWSAQPLTKKDKIEIGLASTPERH